MNHTRTHSTHTSKAERQTQSLFIVQTSSLFPLLGLDFPKVEVQFLALQDVAVGTPVLAWPRGDLG